MKRTHFTRALAELIMYICNEGDLPILDYVKRSDEEQKRLFDLGLSKCDGVNKISQHQKGRAADIYLLDENGALLDWNKVIDKRTKYRDFWENSGGAKMIDWDQGHWE